MKLPKVFHSKYFLGVLVLALLVAGALEYTQYLDRKQIDQEIAGLLAEEERLISTNKQLEQSISFLSSPEYQEKLARMQLNLKKEGEIVVNFPTESASSRVVTNAPTNSSNLINWWKYIFVN